MAVNAMPVRAGPLIALLSAGNFVIGIGAFVVVGLLGPITGGLGLSAGQGGLIMTAYALAYMVGSPLGVALTGGLSRRGVLAGGMALFALGAGLSALAGDLSTLLAARVVAACGAGLFTPVAAGVAVAVSAPEMRGRALSNVFLGLTLAQVVGIPIGGWLGFTFGWQAAFIITAGLAVLCLAGLLALVPRDLAFQVQRLGALWDAVRDLRGLTVILFTATFLGAVYILYTFIGLLLSQSMGYGRDGVTGFLAVYGLGAVLGNLAGGRLADRIGPGRTLTLVACSQIVLLPVFSFLPLPDAAVYALGFLWALFGWSFLVPQQSRLVALAPARQTVTIALNASAIYLGASVGSAIGAAVVEGAGVDALGIAAAVAMLPVLAHLALTLRLVARSSTSSTA